MNMPGHVVLLGDSIFDNARYVPGGTSVIEHVRRKFPADWEATLAAVDGARVLNVYDQLERVPTNATHLVVSAGGNDALWVAGGLLARPANSIQAALREVGAMLDEFQEKYAQLIRRLVDLQKPLTLCTIYDHIPILGPAERTGLRGFNDVITRTAFSHRASLIDLRVLCAESTDYSPLSPIEPSTPGGEKIAGAIFEVVTSELSGSRVIA
jgi:hypothetical protein